MRPVSVLVFLSALLLGCASTATTPLNPEALNGTAWVATEFRTSEMGRETMPRLEFTGADEVRGTGGCNTFRGKASIAAGAVRFGPLASTRRMCAPGTMGGEDRLFKALDEARAMRIENDQLVLIDASGAVVLRLSRSK